MEHESKMTNFTREYIRTTDHLVSHQEFVLLTDDKAEILKTDPVPVDLSKYYESDKYISHTDSSKSLLDRLYQFVKRLNLSRKLKLIQKYAGKSTVLDFGAGTGDFVKFLELQGWRTEGVEPNLAAREKAASKEIFLHKDVSEISLQPEVITLWHVLEHLKDPNNALQLFHQKLAGQGFLFIAVPNFRSYDAHYYGKYWAAFDAPRHLWHFSKNGMEDLLRINGYKIISILPMKFDAFYVSLLSEKNRTGKPKMLRAFYRGFMSNLKASGSGEFSSLIYVAQKA